MSDPLFAIGNHTWEHRNLRLLAGEALQDEIKSAQTAYEAVREDLQLKQCTRPGQTTLAAEYAPKRLSIIRYPFGACNAQTLKATAELGLVAIQWDVSSGDAPPGQSPEEMLKDVLRGVRPGSIVLFHANGRGINTTVTIPLIVSALRAKGYQFVTVPDLLAAGEPEITPTCYDSKPSDTDRYDGYAVRLEIEYQKARTAIVGSTPAAQPGGDAASGSPRPQDATPTHDTSSEETFDSETPLKRRALAKHRPKL